MKTIVLSVLLLLSSASWAELPSWGMTENQYKMPDFSSKLNDIGKVAAKNNWLLKVTAPSDWHKSIREALTNMGDRDVQMALNDSMYNSIAISATPGAKIAKISTSNNNNSTVQKQVVIDKPEIDTAIEAPDFGDTDFNNGTAMVLEEIGSMDLGVAAVAAPKTTGAAVKQEKAAPTAVKEVVETETVTAPAVNQVVAVSTDADIDDIKEALRQRHARSKRVEKSINYSNINSKDELYIQGSVVLVKRFINQGVVLFYWMHEAYDPAVHKLVEKGSGKYQKDLTASKGVMSDKAATETVEPTDLNFIAVDTASQDQNDLRRNNIRNKRVDYTISADKLKAKDVLYVQNQTVLVERPITSAQSVYYWLVGETTIDREVERKGDHMFILK